MNKHNLILLAVGLAAGYFLADNLVGINGGANPFAKAASKGASFAA